MRRHAVFIGINDYANGIPALKCACQDAQKLLEKLQLDDAELLLNDGADDAINAIRKQMKKLQEGDLFIFYFAGHGCEMGGVHYLLGTDADAALIQDKMGLMPMSVVKRLTSKPGVQRLFILDCCRNDPWDTARSLKVSNGNSGSRGMEMLVEESRSKQTTIIPPVILYSCAEGQCSYEDRANRQGFFTGAVLKTLADKTVQNFNEFRSVLQRNMEEQIPRLPGEQEIQWYGNLERKIKLHPSWHDVPPVAANSLVPPEKLFAEAETLMSGEITAESGKKVLDLLQRAGQYPPALNLLGDIYLQGKGVEPDLVLATQYYRESAEAGDMLGQFKYALSCEFAWGMDEPQYETAARNYRLSADQGYARAQHAFANCCAEGIGVGYDAVLAFEYYLKAALQGYHRAECSVGWCYTTGSGVEPDPVQAFKWYLLAADHGNAIAMNNLGMCCEDGRGTVRDLQRAKEYYQAAAEAGNPDGKIKLDRLKARGL